MYLPPFDPRTNPRHPLCPACGYDLFAIVDDVQPRVVVCSECGREVEPDELNWERRPGDWTLMRGIRLGGKAVLIRVVVLAVAWAGLVLGLEAVLGDASIGASSGRTLHVPGLIAGMFLGAAMMWRLCDQAGFESWLLAWMAVAGCWAATIVGVEFALMLSPVFFPDQAERMTFTEPAVLKTLSGISASWTVLLIMAREGG
jgi:hypothetical protein